MYWKLLWIKVISSESGEKYAQIKHCLQAKYVLKNMLVDFDWMKSYYGLCTGILARSDGLKLKHNVDLFHANKQLLIDSLIID